MHFLVTLYNIANKELKQYYQAELFVALASAIKIHSQRWYSEYITMVFSKERQIEPYKASKDNMVLRSEIQEPEITTYIWREYLDILVAYKSNFWVKYSLELQSIWTNARNKGRIAGTNYLHHSQRKRAYTSSKKKSDNDPRTLKGIGKVIRI